MYLRLTLRELDALLVRREQIRRREVDIPWANVCVTLLNIHRNAEARSEPFTLADVLPALGDAEPAEEEENFSREAVFFERIKGWVSSTGGDNTLDRVQFVKPKSS